MPDWVFRPWRQCLSFRGRATRREYWLFIAQLIALFMVYFLLVGMVPAALATEGGAVAVAVGAVIIYLFCLVAVVSASVRRLHDHDKSGWLYLLTMVPLVGWIFYLIMMLTPGTPGENSYGADPREGQGLSPDAVADVFV